MAVSSKTMTVLTLICALCGGTIGGLFVLANLKRFDLGTFGQVAFVSLGAIIAFGTVWFFFWAGQNLFVEEI